MVDGLFGLVPPSRAVLSICLVLFLLGFLCLFLAYYLSQFRKKQREIAEAAVVVEMIGSVVFSDYKPKP